MPTVLSAWFCLTLTGCAGLQAPQAASISDAVNLVWPPTPAQPRITFVKEISFPRDIRKAAGFWPRLKTLFAGEEQIKIIRPYGLALDKHDNLYIADTGAQMIHIYNLSNGGYRRLPRKNDTLRLLSPIDVAVDDRNGRIMVSDSAAGKVYIFAANGEKLQELDDFVRPTGLAVDRARGRLYVVDTAAHRLSVLTMDGKHLFDIGGRGVMPGTFNFPTNVCVDNQGNILVTDSMNFRIQLFTADGRFLTSFGRAGTSPGSFSKPRGIAVDSENHVYVTDAAFDNIQIFSRSGQLLLHLGGPGQELGQFALPAGLVMDGRDRFFVADPFNGRIQVFQFLKESHM